MMPSRKLQPGGWLLRDLPAPWNTKITDEMVAIPNGWRFALFLRGGNVLEIKDRGSLVGLVSHNGPKLNGPMAVLHPNGLDPFILVTDYHATDQKIHGCVKVWDGQRRPLFYSHYDDHGAKEGVLCFFQDGVLRLIQEREKGTAGKQYLVNGTEDGPQVLLADELADGDAEEFKAEMRKLTKLEKAMHDGEEGLKKYLYRNTVGAVTGQKRARSLGSIAGHSAAKAAEFRGFWRGATGR
jgi:hypothetical protein